MEGEIDSKCLESALRMLKVSDKFAFEINAGLLAKGFEPDSVAPVVQHLIRRKLLDDRRSINNLIARKSGKRAVGVEKIRAELESRGAPETLIDECLSQIPYDGQRQAMLDALGAKFQPEGDRVRGARFLLSRGFSEDEIESALDEFFQTD